MLQDWTKYETEVLEGHTGPPHTTSRTTWDNVVRDGDIGAAATTVHTTFEDSSRPDHPFGNNNNPAITNAILAYHSWSTQQTNHLHTPHDDPREWHPVLPPAPEFYLHENATTGAHSITSLRPTVPQPIPEPHIPRSPTKPQTPPQHEHEPPQRGHSPPAHKRTETSSATTTVQQLDKPLISQHIPDNYQLPRGGNHTRGTATTWRLPKGTIDWKKIFPGIRTMEVMCLLTPHQVELTQAMHLFITTQAAGAIEGTAPGDDDQTPGARPTPAVWINATAGHRTAGYLGTVPGDLGIYILPNRSREHATPLHGVESSPLSCPHQSTNTNTSRGTSGRRHQTGERRPTNALWPNIIVHPTAHLPKDFGSERHIGLKGQAHHIITAALYTPAANEHHWDPTAIPAMPPPPQGPKDPVTPFHIDQLLSRRATAHLHPSRIELAIASWDTLDTPPQQPAVHILKADAQWWVLHWAHGVLMAAQAYTAEKDPEDPPRGRQRLLQATTLTGRGGAPWEAVITPLYWAQGSPNGPDTPEPTEAWVNQAKAMRNYQLH